MGRQVGDLLRRPPATLLVWSGSVVLGLADVCYAGVVPGPRRVLTGVALALAAVAGGMFVAAAIKGLSRAMHRSPRQPVRRPLGTRHGRGDSVTREAEWGIMQIEAWLARQDHTQES